ncbi:MAG: acetyl-CoA carboxylase biotin carboxylase subunit [Myxococcales bacterium]|nr:acetyl-CoA carboxylase biotin carboxylase subunit [Myxococcales bacterium]USN51954.1 MAG: acetyl-CoA carboxylase biotin carboxylase subunit [Myxococcales bacterium]
MKNRKIKKVLVANRGEIAVRVMRTCRDLGLETVAVYSDPDRSALHVRFASEAYHIGSASPKESYLNIEKIIDVAKKSKADAIHPGYGFLSENPQFAEAVKKAGLILIGPKSSSMEAMGTKTRARQVMIKAGVPVVPGLETPVKDEAEAKKIAIEIGFPVMLKAVYGGGGKGMRKVDREENFISAFRMAQSEARNSFGNDEVYIEKFLNKPRHIEMQILADMYGNVAAFVERECSVQRRHQKLIEESPSPFVDQKMREKMAEVAKKAALAVDYIGAGTIEFLVDDQKNFYFMEMNTRLQVEHPITEMVSGLDLVAEQIDIAEGKELSGYDFIKNFNGWAMEARVCAEDPARDFVPTPGPVNHLRVPGGPYTRTDSGIYAGSEITPDYDPMIAKLVAWGPNRDIARRRLDRALMEFALKGCTTNTMFLRQILAFEPFIDGSYDTSVIAKYFKETPTWYHNEHKIVALLGAAIFSFEKEKKLSSQISIGKKNNPEASISKWRTTNPYKIF